MKLQAINNIYETNYNKPAKNKFTSQTISNTYSTKSEALPNIASNYNNQIAFGNKIPQFVTGKNQDLFLELSDKAKKAVEATISVLRISARRNENEVISASSKSRDMNGNFHIPVGYFDDVDNSPFKNVTLQEAVFFDAKGNKTEELKLLSEFSSPDKVSCKTVRIIDGKQEVIDKNISIEPSAIDKKVKLKSVIMDGFESQNDFDVFATAKSEGKFAIFDSYENLKNYEGENVIALLTSKASTEMFNDMVMETVMNVKNQNYQNKLDKLKEKFNAGKITEETYKSETEVQRLVNEDFFLPLNVKGLIAPKQPNFDIVSLFSNLGHVRARLQNRQSVFFAPESFTNMLTERYSVNDKIRMKVYPTGLKIDKIENITQKEEKVVLQKPQYVDTLLTFNDDIAIYNQASTGIKAFNLKILSKLAKELNIKIPETFVIPAGFVNRMKLDLTEKDTKTLDALYEKSLTLKNAAKRAVITELQEELKRMQLKILNKEIPADCKTELEKMLKKFGFDKEKGIVRSSMNGEDNKNLQTAGLYDSVIFDGIDEFWNSMKEVVASKWSYMAYLSRMQHKIPHKDVSINMPVQKLVNGDYIGTAYTADARTGDTNKLIVQMAPGIDCTIAGTPYTFTTDILSGDVERILARKKRKKSLSLMTKEDRAKKLNYLPTNYSRDFWNKTPDEYRPQLRRITDVLKKIKAAFRTDQDVEFVLKLKYNEQDIAKEIEDIYIVQTRDIKM